MLTLCFAEQYTLQNRVLNSGIRYSTDRYAMNFSLAFLKQLFLPAGLLILAGCATPAAHPALKTANDLPDLIPVRDFVANLGSNWGYQISPDGKKLAWIGVKGISLHFFVKDLERNLTRTFPAGNFYGAFEWAQDSRRLIYTIQQGDEDTVYVTFDTEQSGSDPQVIPVSPWGGVRAQLLRQVANDPAHVLIEHNQRDKSVFDLYKVNIDSKESSLIALNPGNAINALIDTQGVYRGRIIKQGDALAIELLQADAATYKTVYQWASGDLVNVLSIADGGATLYLLSNKGRDRRVLLELSAASGAEKILYEDPAVDISSVYTHPVTGRPLIAYTEPDFPKAVLLDPALRDSLKFLNRQTPAYIAILSSDRQFRRMTFSVYTDKGSAWYLYDMAQDHVEQLGLSPSLAHKDDLADMTPLEIRSRDGLALHGYLTLPKGMPARHLPMVLWVHGGPWWRDSWGYNPEVQFLANRGYAVMQINFRGSLGYGRRFEELAIGEFAGRMHDDLLDAVQWAIDRGIADPAKVAIAGGSYGGYATLVGLSFTPERFACGIDIFGPSDLVKLAEEFPPYWKFEMDRWHRYIGDPGNPSDRKIMQSKSPISKADNIVKPLLVVQGGMDVRVRTGQSEALVNQLRRANKPVEYWFIPGAGHGITHWPQRLQQFRMTEDFLAACLGGRNSGFDYYQLGAWLF